MNAQSPFLSNAMRTAPCSTTCSASSPDSRPTSSPDSRPAPGPGSRPTTCPTSEPAPCPTARSAADPASLVLVNTGDGKGKSTAAFGVVLRALAQGWPVCVIQFLKSSGWSTGEERICERLGVTWIKGGTGFTWEAGVTDEARACARAAWAVAAEVLTGGGYRLVVLDELTLPLSFHWLETAQVVETLRSRQEGVNVIITGRGAPAELLEMADVVTEMVKVRHPFDSGILARAGIDF